MKRWLPSWVSTIALAAGLVGASPAGAAGTSVTISGTAFLDGNRDGVKQTSEQPLAGKYVYLFDPAGAYLRNALTAADGRYVMAGVAPGSYRVEYGQSEWWELWRDWVPSTTDSIRPRVDVSLATSAVVDFGWRPIIRSDDPAVPVSTFEAPNGLVLQSYNDAVTARDVFDAMSLGTLQGEEAPLTVVRFDQTSSDFCLSSITQTGAVYDGFRAECNVDYLRWLQFGDRYLFHEYGHAWGAYHAYIVGQDPSLAGYLAARGIDKNDPRLGTTHAWSQFEMLAEDYRQLFGSPNAQPDQENQDIPPAAAVAGVRDYLSGPFMHSGPPSPPPPPPPTVHVGDFDGRSAKAGRGWDASVTAAVHDAGEQAVSGAAVRFTYTDDKGRAAGASCTTTAGGTCTVTVRVAAKRTSLPVSVADVTVAGATYAGAQNHDPDGDSDGTAIVVRRPA